VEFNSSLFLLMFLPLAAVIYYAAPAKYRNLILLASSIVFYAWGEPIYCFMLIISLIVNNATGKYIASHDGGNKKLMLIVSIVFNLAVACIFRYAEFLSISLREFISLFWMGLGSFVPIIEYSLPFGIAVYTLQALSYNIDIYRGSPCLDSVVDTGVYLAFFPQLIVGPITKYNVMLPQIKSRDESIDKVKKGIIRFSIGLIKKVLVANNLKIVADGIFALTKTSLSITISWTGVICLALQVLYDFSGYVDMAIGIAEIFGFDLPNDIVNPYGARSVTDFWRNHWRISISSWFKEYIYIPLGGNRKIGGNEHSRFWMYFNMGVTILLCAVWYNASWLTILVGIYYGIFLMIEKTRRAEKIRAKLPDKVAIVLGNIYTAAVVIFGWMMLRVSSATQLWTFIKAMAGFGYINTRMGIREFFDNESFIIFIFALIFALPFTKYLLEKLKNILSEKISCTETVINIAKTLIVLVLTAFTVLTVTSGGDNVFDYFRY